MIHRLRQQEATGACELWYLDVTGFCLPPCLPYAWQPLGSVITVPTSTHRRRLHVLGFLPHRNALCPYIIEGKVDTAVTGECFEQLSQQLNKRTYVLLDHAPTPQSTEFIRHMPQWGQRGSIIQYLPPYSPALNLIEILWRFIKYHWLPFSADRSFPCLLGAIEDILIRFGTDYRIVFQTIGI